jgi:hypothetical protein
MKLSYADKTPYRKVAEWQGILLLLLPILAVMTKKGEGVSISVCYVKQIEYIISAILKWITFLKKWIYMKYLLLLQVLVNCLISW